MTPFAFSSNPVLLVAECSFALALGTGIGLAHYLLLWRNVETLVSGESFIRALLLHLGRFLATGVALYLVARLGALPLGAALLGLVFARRLIVRRIGSSA